MDKPMTDRELALLIQTVEKDQMITAPKYLKENIIIESQKTGVQIAQKTTKLPVKVELLLYGLKISAAVVGAIFLLGVIDMNQSMMNPGQYATQSYEREGYKKVEESAKANNDRANKIAEHLNQKSNAVSSRLNEFSNNLIGGNKR